MVDTPYSQLLGDRDPLAAMADSAARIERLVSGWTPGAFEKTYAPGKWTARQILVHLAQTELMFGGRARMALTTDGYVVQPFDGDAWVAREAVVPAAAALRAFLGLREMNRALFRGLTPADRARAFHHPERGTLTVDYVVHLLPGHDLNHLAQLETIGQAGVQP